MALTRKFLKALEIEGDKAEQIIEAHTETVDGLKASLETAQADAGKMADLQKQLESAQADLEAVKKDGWKEKHDKLKEEYEKYKADIAEKETKAAKESAARAYFESKGITGKALDIAVRGSSAEIAALELADGKIKDTASLEALVEGDFSGLVGQTHTEGAPIATPPTNVGGTKTKDEIFKIRDASERQRAIAENIELFRKE